MQKKIIGRVQKISLPTLQLEKLDAKIDTGAYSCALHCDNISIEDTSVSFHLLDLAHESYNNKFFKLPLFKLKRVKSSNGKTELRPYIKVPVVFCDEKFNMVLSLTNRSKMKYPLLIGRKFLSDKFLVDVSQKYM